MTSQHQATSGSTPESVRLEAQKRRILKLLSPTDAAPFLRLLDAIAGLNAIIAAQATEIQRLHSVIDQSVRLNHRLAAECVQRQNDQMRQAAEIQRMRAIVRDVVFRIGRGDARETYINDLARLDADVPAASTEETVEAIDKSVKS